MNSATSNALRLLLINQYAVPSTAPGITRHAILAELLSNRGVTTTIISSDTHYWNVDVATEFEAVRSSSGVKFETVPGSPLDRNGVRRIFSMLWFSVRAILRGSRLKVRPDVVLGSSPHLFGALAAWILSVRFRVPFVLEVRDVWPRSLQELMGLPAWHPVIFGFSMIERFLYHRADLIITLLLGSEGHIRSVSPRAGRVVWIPNGIDVERLPPLAPIPRGKFVAMYTGAHGIPNNLDVVINAAHLIDSGQIECNREIRFVLIGAGKEKGRLRQMSSDLRLTTVEFRDPIPKEAIPTALAEAHVLMLPAQDTSLYDLGISPNKLFDYFGSGRPIVFGLKTPIDPVRDSGSGWTVPPADPYAFAQAIALAASLPDKELARIGSRGRSYVTERHDLQELADSLSSELHELIRVTNQ